MKDTVISTVYNPHPSFTKDLFPEKLRAFFRLFAHFLRSAVATEMDVWVCVRGWVGECR